MWEKEENARCWPCRSFFKCVTLSTRKGDPWWLDKDATRFWNQWSRFWFHCGFSRGMWPPLPSVKWRSKHDTYKTPPRRWKESVKSKMLILNTYESFANSEENLPTTLVSLVTGVVPPSTTTSPPILGLIKNGWKWKWCLLSSKTICWPQEWSTWFKKKSAMVFLLQKSVFSSLVPRY